MKKTLLALFVAIVTIPMAGVLFADDIRKPTETKVGEYVVKVNDRRTYVTMDFNKEIRVVTLKVVSAVVADLTICSTMKMKSGMISFPEISGQGIRFKDRTSGMTKIAIKRGVTILKLKYTE